ncbi:MAG: helix-turn-helix domain-containing protein [Saccharofermentanales bacterium]
MPGSTPLHSEYITGRRIDESFGRYRLSCKVGSYSVFGYDQISNQRHRHDCYELCLVISGKGSYLYNDAICPIQEGDLIIAEPDLHHEIQAGQRENTALPTENLVLLYIFITISENARLARAESFGDRCIAGFLRGHNRKASQIHLLSYIRFIESYNSPNKKNPYGTSEALKNLILESLAALSANSNAPAEEIVKNIFENALDYIDANLHTKILVSEIAADSCTTVRNLEYLFHKNLGKTVVGYINEKKTDLACHYLSMYFNVTDTAEMVGIHNVSQFSTMFKKSRQISPQEYQKMILGDKKGMGRRI